MNKIEKILLYESSSGFGGSSVALANLINNLDRQKYAPVVAYTNPGTQIGKIKDAQLIKMREYKEPDKISNFRYVLDFLFILLPEAFKLFFVIRWENVKIVHINTNVLLGIPAIIAAKLAGVPVVCHVRETREIIRREKYFVKWVDRFVVINKRVVEMYKQYVPADKISLIYDGIDMGVCQEIDKEKSFRKDFHLNGSPVVGLVGRIVEGKGHREFILAAKEVLKVKPDVKFAIIGDAKGADHKCYAEIKELVQKERMEQNIIFTGWINEVMYAIADLDILIQATTTFLEGFGLTIIEAMVFCKPVVATDIPGPSDIVENEKTGFLVPAGDAGAMACKILYLLDHPQIAKAMGESGRERVRELFDIKKQVKKIEALYSNFNL